MRDIGDYAKKYIQSNFENNYQVKYRRKKVLEEISKYAHRNILEIGCGLTSLAEDVDDFNSFTVIEPSECFINYARSSLEQKAPARIGRVRFLQGLFPEGVIEAISDNSYDFVVVSSLLHEVENPSKLLDGILAIADNDTIIHLNVPNAYSLHRLLAYEAGIIEEVEKFSERNISYQQHSVFSLKSLMLLLNNWGETYNLDIDVLDKGSYFIKPFTHAQMEKSLEYGIIDANVIQGFDKLIKYMPDLGSEIFVNFKLKKK